MQEQLRLQQQLTGLAQAHGGRSDLSGNVVALHAPPSSGACIRITLNDDGSADIDTTMFKLSVTWTPADEVTPVVTAIMDGNVAGTVDYEYSIELPDSQLHGGTLPYVPSHRR